MENCCRFVKSRNVHSYHFDKSANSQRKGHFDSLFSSNSRANFFVVVF